MQTTYDDMLKKKKISQFLGLEADGPWEIVSENGDLVMVHYSENADMNIYGALRGVVVDMNKGNIVCYSYPHATTVTSSELCVTNDEIQLSDNIKLNLNNIKINMGFEGTLMHVFKHAGNVYKVTRKRLDPSKSRWGNSKTFGEIYSELNGPSDETFFDNNKKYSPYCHTFILVHPDLLVATRCPLGNENNSTKGFLVYLGPKQMYSTDETCPYSLEEVDTELHTPPTTNIIPLDNENQTVYFHPPAINLQEANNHLLFGFCKPFDNYQNLDQRLLPGEFVIIEDLTTHMMYKIESPSYQWRCMIRNNNPNLLHRFFELLDTLNSKNNNYNEMFCELTMYKLDSLQEVVKKSPLIFWPQMYNTVIPDTRDAKLYNIWQNFLIAVPLHRQLEVINYYEYYMTRRNQVTEWLYHLSSNLYPSIDTENYLKINLQDFSKRVQDILVKTRNFAEDRVKKGDDRDPKTKQKKGVDFWTQVNIKNFINKELGSSLYRLIREMDKYNSSKVDSQNAQ
jgi:hypothetical protein